MRILQVTRRYAPEVIGGYERNCQVFSEEWVRRGHDVAVLTRAPAADRPAASVDGVHVFRELADLPTNRNLHGVGSRVYQLRIAAANRRARGRTRQVLRHWQPDAVVFWGMNSWLVSPVLATHDAGIPCLADLGDYWLIEALDMYRPVSARRAWYRQRVMLGGRLLPDMFREVWVHSDYMRQRYVDSGLAPERVRVIPRGLGPAYLEESPRRQESTGPVRILCVGRLVPDKGARVLAEAFTALRRHTGDVELHFYGDSWDWYRRDLENDCRRAGLLDKGIFIHERVPPERMQELYASHDILAFPVLWNEPSSNVLIEAMAMRLPIVASATGSNGEFVQSGETGFLVPPNDAALLAQRLGQLCGDAALRLRMGETARQRVLARHRPEQVFDANEARLQMFGSA
jgi:glycosyltransferase involved in cell wall biosynthesis